MQNARQVFFADEHPFTLFEGKYTLFVGYKRRFYGIKSSFCLYISVPGLFHFLVYK
jgi:hypothetical protein